MKSFEEIRKTSVLDLHLLTPEENRVYELNGLVGNRMLEKKYTAQEIFNLWQGRFDYNLEEIQNMINKRGMK